MIPGWTYGLSKVVSTFAEAFAHCSGKTAQEAREAGVVAGAGIGCALAGLTMDPVGAALLIANAHNQEQRWKSLKP